MVRAVVRQPYFFKTSKLIMKYAIIGTGAIGGFYGARLDKAGFEVHFLLHTDYQYVVDHGLTIDS